MYIRPHVDPEPNVVALIEVRPEAPVGLPTPDRRPPRRRDLTFIIRRPPLGVCSVKGCCTAVSVVLLVYWSTVY